MGGGNIQIEKHKCIVTKTTCSCNYIFRSHYAAHETGDLKEHLFHRLRLIHTDEGLAFVCERDTPSLLSNEHHITHNAFSLFVIFWRRVVWMYSND